MSEETKDTTQLTTYDPPDLRATHREAAANAQVAVVEDRARLAMALELDLRIQNGMLELLARQQGGPYLADFGGKCRLNAAGAAMIARSMGIQITELSAHREPYEDDDGKSQWYWEVSVRATHPATGAHNDASDICTSEDGVHVGERKDGTKFKSIGDRLQSTRKHARERAIRQAISELCGIRSIPKSAVDRLGIPVESVKYGGNR
jgi:hypothetical protein